MYTIDPEGIILREPLGTAKYFLMWLTTNESLSSSVIGFGSILMPNSAFTTWDYPLEENKIESNSPVKNVFIDFNFYSTSWSVTGSGSWENTQLVEEHQNILLCPL